MAQSKKHGPFSLSQKMARAYAHPIRARALMLLGARTASPREIADEIGESLGKVSYHVRELRDAGLIELVETDSTRGGVQHFYRAAFLPIINAEGMSNLDAEEKAAASTVVISLMVADVAAAVEGRTIDRRPEQVLVRYHALVDREGWEELSELYTNMMYRSIDIGKEARERLEESGEEGIPAGMHALMFELPTADHVTQETALEWIDEEDPPIPSSGGSEGRRADEGDAEG
jgi:DNA-binding transcriptional ArsR family regulator